jgi:hypothetical protein
MMPDPKKLSRAGRSPTGGAAKKVVSLTIDPALIPQIDAYAKDKGMSRSAAIEAAIASLLALDSSDATTENRLVQSDCVFASSSLDTAILY